MVRFEYKKMDGESGQGLVTLLTQLTKALHRLTSEELLGMRLRQFHTLSYVSGHEGVTQQELGEAFLIDPNSMVLLLNELEAAGLSLRRRDPADRRRHLVELTPAGRKAVERAVKSLDSLEGEVLAGLNQEERATLKSLLSRVLESLLRVPAEPAKH